MGLTSCRFLPSKQRHRLAEVPQPALVLRLRCRGGNFVDPAKEGLKASLFSRGTRPQKASCRPEQQDLVVFKSTLIDSLFFWFRRGTKTSHPLKVSKTFRPGYKSHIHREISGTVSGA